MKITSVLISLTLISVGLFGQTPGYMGKKLSLFYTMAVFPSINNGSESDLGINLRNDFALDYAVSKSVAIGGSFKYLQTSVKQANYYTDDVTLPVQKAFSGDVKLKGPAFSIYVKKFAFRKKGYISPVGFYNKFEFCYGKFSGTAGKRNSPSDPEQFVYVNDFETLGFNNQLHTAGLIYSFGRQTLYLDRLFVTTGGSFALMFPSGLVSGNGVDSGHYGTEYNYTSDAQWRMFGYFMFNINIGIGLLAL